MYSEISSTSPLVGGQGEIFTHVPPQALATAKHTVSVINVCSHRPNRSVNEWQTDLLKESCGFIIVNTIMSVTM